MVVGRLGVVGAGVMGSEIAWLGARAGLPVVLRDAAAAALDAGVTHVRALTDAAAARGRLGPGDAEALPARIVTAGDDAALAGCDLVVEAVTERMEVKRAVMEALDAVLAPGALIASNTSGLSITDMGAATGRPDRVLGLHFFNPASRMELVEVVRGRDTSEETLRTGEDLVRLLGKTPVRVRECPGFLVNRVLVRAMAAAYRAAREADVRPADADAAVTALAPVPMGPFALGDLIGLDTLAHIRRDLAAAYGDRFEDGGVLDAAVAAGRLGRKSGSGLRDAEETPPEPGPAAGDVAEAYAEAAVDEARRCRDEGVAAPEDVDRALRLGAGWREGPLAWAASRAGRA